MTRAELEKLLRDNMRSLSEKELAELLAVVRAMRAAREQPPSAVDDAEKAPRKLGLLSHATFKMTDDFSMSDEELLRS